MGIVGSLNVETRLLRLVKINVAVCARHMSS